MKEMEKRISCAKDFIENMDTTVKENKKAKRLDDRPKSKFTTKYNERIRSIKNSDTKREEKRRWIEEE